MTVTKFARLKYIKILNVKIMSFGQGRKDGSPSLRSCGRCNVLLKKEKKRNLSQSRM